MSKVLLCVNSDIGRGNTIGFRFGKIAEELQRRNLNFEILARSNYHRGLMASYPWYQNYLARFFNFLRIYVFPFWQFRSLDIYLFDLFVLKRLKKHCLYDVAMVGEFIPRSLSYLRNHGVKIVLDIPIAHPAYAESLFKQGIMVGVETDRKATITYFNQAIFLADVVVVPSEFVKDSLNIAGCLVKELQIIPFGTSVPKDFNESDIIHRAQDKKLIFLFAGNVNYRKGIKYLLEAWKLADLKDAELVICGRVYKEIKEVINNFRLPNVHYTGFVNLKEYYQKAHVFIFPTLLEGSAKAVYEAMGYGLPVITTKAAGSIVSDNKTGFIIPVADVQLLRENIVFFSDNRIAIEEMGLAGRKKVENYSWESYAARVCNILLRF